MANPQPLVALPGEDLYTTAVLSMTNPDASYPIANSQDHDPATLAKATTASTAITINCGIPVTPKAIAIIHSNAVGTATLTGSGGLNTTVTLPGLEFVDHGERLNGWKSLVGLSGVTSTIFTLTLTTTAATVFVGRVCLVLNLHPLNLRYGLAFGILWPGRIVLTTRLGSKVLHDAGIRMRTATGVVNLAEDEALLRELEANARGSLLPFLFVPDEGTNDAWYVRFRADDFTWSFPDIDVTEIPIAVEELAMGPPNG
jgi:hypothetical protein